jgi:hypothetical protein
VFKKHFWGDKLSIFGKIKDAFSKKEEEMPVRRQVPLAIRTEPVEKRINVEDSLLQMQRDFLSRRIQLSTLLDALDDLRDKVQDDDVLARSKRLPSTLYGIFTATGEPKVQRIIAEVIHVQAVKGNLDAIRIAKMLNQLANDHVTKDLLSRASNK